MPRSQSSLIRTLASLSLLGVLLLASLKVLEPFLLAITWATMIVVASWPLMQMLEARLGGRRWLAVSIMTLGLLTVIFLPFTLAVGTLIRNADQIVALAATIKSEAPPVAPAWLARLPVVGERATQLWVNGAQAGMNEIALRAAPYAGDLTRWFAARIGHLGLLLVQVILAIAVSAILYAHGELCARAMRRFARLLSGERGEAMVKLATGAIRGVALGVGVTALIQAVLGGIGLAITGIPFASLLAALMFLLCIAQIGVLPVLAPAVVWLYWDGQTGWGTFLLVWMLVVVNLDNFLRPWLIQRGADLPLLLILTGVIGGLIGFGLVGIFLGPLVLAVSYTLVRSWLSEAPEPPPQC